MLTGFKAKTRREGIGERDREIGRERRSVEEGWLISSVSIVSGTLIVFLFTSDVYHVLVFLNSGAQGRREAKGKGKEHKRRISTCQNIRNYHIKLPPRSRIGTVSGTNKGGGGSRAREANRVNPRRTIARKTMRVPSQSWHRFRRWKTSGRFTII